MEQALTKGQLASLRTNDLLKTLQNFENPYSLTIRTAPITQVQQSEISILESKVEEPALAETEDETTGEEVFPRERPSASSLLETLRAAASALELISEEGNVIDWIRENSPDDSDAIEELGRTCGVISNRIQPSGQPCGTLEEIESFYLFRGPSFMMILQPVETFRALKTRSLATKTISFATIRGSGGLPLQYGISGWTDFLQPHPKFLDCAFWTTQVLNLSLDLNSTLFPKGRLDDHHGVAVGTDYASHAENRIILSSACELAGRLFGKKDVRDQIAALPNLRTLSNLPTILVYVSEEPCKRCKRFRDLVQEYTSIKFVFRFLQRKLGEVKGTGPHGPYQRFANVVDGAEEEPTKAVSPRKRAARRVVEDTSSDESDYSPWVVVTPRKTRSQPTLITPVTSPGNSDT